MPIWHAVLLGVIQGLTEFLPISSTAHLLIAQELLGYDREKLKEDPFTIVIQVGTLVAVYWYFRADIARLLRAFFADLTQRHFLSSASDDGRLAKQIIVGTIPAVLAGLFLRRWLKDNFYNPTAIAWVSITFALLMAASEWWASRRKNARGDSDVTYLDALIVGCFQALALMPGGSRSGTTITAGLFIGLARPTAARFSFLLSLPIILGAGLKELYDWYKMANAEQMQQQGIAMLVGGIVSAVVGYISIAWLLRYLRVYTMTAFVLYRIALGVTILGLIAAGWVR